MKSLLCILVLLVEVYLWNSLDHIYWTNNEKPQELQLNINAHTTFTPQQMEREAVRPIEYILKDFDEVKTFSSFILGQYARIMIQLKPKADIETFKIRVNEKFRQKWPTWKFKIKYPTWEKEMNNKRQTISYAGITSDRSTVSKEALQKLLNQEKPSLTIDRFSPLRDKELNIQLSKDKLSSLQIPLPEIKNQLARQYQKLPSIPQLLYSIITNPAFLMESLRHLKEGRVTPSNPKIWVQGQPAYSLEISSKKTLRQLFQYNSLSPINLDEKISLYPINSTPQLSLKILKWSLLLFLFAPVVPLLLQKFEILLLIVMMEFSLFAFLIYFSEPLSTHLLWLFCSAMAWTFFDIISGHHKLFFWGYLFLLGCLMLFNHWVAPDYNLNLLFAVFGVWTLSIGIYDWVTKKQQKRPPVNYKGKLKYFWMTLSLLGIILVFLWIKNKNNFFIHHGVVSIKQSNERIRLGVTLHHGQDKFEFTQNLLLLLKEIQRLPEVHTIHLDTRIPDGLTAIIDLNKKANHLRSSQIRNELEKFILSHPNQTFLLEGIGKELAQTSAIIFRGIHLVLKGFHYPELIKQALTVRNNLKENRRVTQTYFGHTPGPIIEAAHENILIKTSRKNKELIDWIIGNQMPQKAILDFNDYQINFSLPPPSKYQWTNIHQTPIYIENKLQKNPFTESSKENFNQPYSLFKKDGIFEIVIGFNFLGSKRQADTFLRQKQQEIKNQLPFGLSVEHPAPNKDNIWFNLIGGSIILSCFFYILGQNNLWEGIGISLVFIFTFFIGHWLFIAFSTSKSIIPSIPLLSYWIFSICQIHGKILFIPK